VQKLAQFLLWIARRRLQLQCAMLRMMCVTAHPDDEAGNFGGCLQLYAGRGVETCVICLTPGQAATHRGSAKNDMELAETRRREFTAACAILKVTKGIVLDCPDGQLHRMEAYKVACELTLKMREFRPQVVLTFGPEGGVTGHTDHSMASVFATLAFHWAGRSNRYPDQLSDRIRPHRAKKLYYATTNFALPDRQPVTPSAATTVIEVGKYLETKLEAFKAHTTQTPLFAMFESRMRQYGGEERFHLAASINPAPGQIETDLFAGIEDQD
jgi:LmbE family N-acetylglucosaminyl deacetylase